ncbi:hypothetical protein ScPMuIL_011063 [Solemya velum]
MFSEHGIPECLFSDGGPCYNSKEFREFTEKWRVRHVMTSPHFPQSNGFIERTIQTTKAAIKKQTIANWLNSFQVQLEEKCHIRPSYYSM